MIDFQKIKDSWGYESGGYKPSGSWGSPGSGGAGTTAEERGQNRPSSVNEPTPYSGGTTMTLPTTGGTTMANTANSDFNYPSEWGQAGDQWSQMAAGNYTNPGMDWLTKLMQSGGGAFDQSGYDAANQPAMMDQFSNMTKQMAEQAGMGGSRYGSGLLNSIGNYGGQLQNQYNKDKWNNAFQGYEAGMGRAANAGQGLAQFGLGSQQTGLEGLFGLGNAKAQLPLQVSQLLNNQDMGWAQLLGQNTGNQNAAPQTYTPSMFQSILSSLSGTLPSALGSLGSNAGSSGAIELPSWMQSGAAPMTW